MRDEGGEAAGGRSPAAATGGLDRRAAVRPRPYLPRKAGEAGARSAGQGLAQHALGDGRSFGPVPGWRVPDVVPLMPKEALTLQLTPRRAEALRALAALEDLPPEVYAAEVLAKHLYHAYTPEAARRAARARPAADAG